MRCNSPQRFHSLPKDGKSHKTSIFRSYWRTLTRRLGVGIKWFVEACTVRTGETKRADSGAKEISAWTLHASMSEVDHYTASASQQALAESALARTLSGQAVPNPAKGLGNKGGNILKTKDNF